MLNPVGAAKYGMAMQPSFGADVSGAANGAVTTAHSYQNGLDSPMLWLLGIGAVTLGLVAASTHVRVGKFNASASV